MELTNFTYYKVNRKFLEEMKPTIAEEVMAPVHSKYESAKHLNCTLYFIICKYEGSSIYSYQFTTPKMEKDTPSIGELLEDLLKKFIRNQIKEDRQNARRNKIIPH